MNPDAVRFVHGLPVNGGAIVRFATMLTRSTGTRAFAVLLLCLAAPAPLEAQRGGGGDSDEAAFLRAAGEHFDTPRSEVLVLTRWGLSATEIPVVLRLAKRAGVSPDVVVSRRRHGASWMEIAHGYSVHAGDFHVPIDGSRGFLTEVYERFSARPASQWREISLSDVEVVGLVNIRFLSRKLDVRPEQVVEAMGDGSNIVGAFIRLRRGG